MRKDYYAAHVSQNLPRLDKDAAANGSNVVHLSGSMERRGFDIQPCAAYFTLLMDTKAGHGEAKADTARRAGPSRRPGCNEGFPIALRSVLRTAVCVMDATWRRLSPLDGGVKRGKRQANVDRAADCIADHPSRPGVEDHRNIDKAIDDGDVRVSRPKGFRLRPLAEPDVNLSTHPAPIIHPKTDSPSTNGRTRVAGS